MNRIIILLTALFTMIAAHAEAVKSEKFTLSPDSPVGYTLIKDSDSIRAYMLLFPGFGESIADVFSETDLPTALSKNGIAVIMPTLQDGEETYGFSDESQQCLAKVVDEATTRFELSGLPYFVGGFSMGGATAVKYAETADKKPAGVFIIDSPLDYQRYSFATKRDIEVYGKDTQDSIYSKLFRDIEAIKDQSPYLISDASHTAIIPLKDIPVRVYIEPAEDWWLNNRNTDALGLNIIDATCFVNDLRLISNDRANLIITRDKGYRKSTNQRHPHSWSIVDVPELLQWIDQCLPASK